MYRLHVLGIPHTRTRPDYTSCAITQKCLHFCQMMHARGHEIYHYGVEGSNPPCTENVTVVSNDVYNKVYGQYDILGPFPFDVNDECYTEFMRNAIAEIGKRKKPLDIILPFWGCGVKTVCDAHPDLITIEPGIGYVGSFADIRVYESYAWMHCQVQDVNNPNWYHTVIPPFFNLNEFQFGPSYEERRKDPYFLHVGRVNDSKGVHIAMEVCQKLGVKLKLAGWLYDHYAEMDFPENIEYVGPVGVENRKELMANAIGLFMPSIYAEPFGYVQVESMLSGTPVITTDWGAFPETNIQGVTGYRCRTFEDFINAANNCLDGKIDYGDCRRHGEEYSFASIAPKYEKFFGDVTNLYNGDGWYQISQATEERIENHRRVEDV